jgi:hypothetical protein
MLSALERATEKSWDDFSRESAPQRLGFRRSYMMDLYASPDLTSQLTATGEAEFLLRDTKFEASGTAHASDLDKPKSR